MKDISKELLSPGEVGQLDGVEYMAVRSGGCALCALKAKKRACERFECGMGHIHFVKV